MKKEINLIIAIALIIMTASLVIMITQPAELFMSMLIFVLSSILGISGIVALPKGK
jgi:hypothetical protein